MIRPSLVCLAALVLLQSPAGAQTPAGAFRDFLENRIGLEPGQLTALERGEPVVKVLESGDPLEVAVFGVVRVEGSRVAWVERLADFPVSLRTATRARLGIFHAPARPADVGDLRMPGRDAEALRVCRPGNCKVKLPATDMERLREEIVWSGPDVAAQLDAYARQRVVRYVNDYRARGNAALVVYDDAKGVHASDAFAALLARSPYVYQEFPSLQRYLSGYPHAPLDGSRDVIYWALDSVADLRPLLTVTHAVLYQPPDTPGIAVLASKLIYANHYFEAALDLTVVLDRPSETGRPGSYLAVLRRFRFDNLQAGPVNMRGRIERSFRDQLRGELASRRRETSP